MSKPDNQLDFEDLFGPIDNEWQSTTRSIRINGKVTSVRLENFYWRIVAEIAENKGLTVSRLITKLARLAKNSETDHANFTSFLRVCCVRYLEKSRIPESAGTSRAEKVSKTKRSKLAALDANSVC